MSAEIPDDVATSGEPERARSGGAGPGQAETPVLTTQGLSKRFPGVLAVDHVSLAIQPGEIVALLGQNGAGKSTVMQILAGVYPHGTYEGTIMLAGAPFAPASVGAAEAAGIVLIPQEVNVVPELTVAENIFLNREPGRWGLVDRPRLMAEAAEILREFDVAVAPGARMGTLDLATQQLVVIARALSQRARLLILDEPTAALSESEAQRLFARMRALRARGVACIFVSHRLGEVFAVADRILVIRDGRLQGDFVTAATSRDEIVAAMIGGAVDDAARQGAARAGVALTVSQLTAHDPEDASRKRVDDVSFDLHNGEILGLFGLLGAGCGAVAEAIFGAWPGRVTGAVRIGGWEGLFPTPQDAIQHGLGLLPQDRRATLIHEHAVADNVVLASLPALSPRGIVDRDRKALSARGWVRDLHIRTPSIETRVGALSGGNQQKVQIARWLEAESRVLLLVDPTRGVDVGARAEINRLWRQLADDGYALLLVSSEAEELVELCDRVLVMRQGRVCASFAGQEITVGRLLAAAAGV